MKKLLVILSLFASAAVFTSCGPSRYTVREQPAVPYYARPTTPGGGYVWVDGEWYYRSGRYAYTNGYWARPKRGHTVYVTGSWVKTNRGYYWRRGYWR